MSKCKYCGGDGWVEVDVGQVYECVQCNSTGTRKVLSDESYDKVLEEVNSPSMPTLALRRLMRRKP